MMANITKLEEILASTVKNAVDNSDIESNNTTNKSANGSLQKQKSTIIKGKPKSGRVWKGNKERFRSIIKTPGLNQSFEKKQKLRQDLKRVKEASRALIEAKKKAREEKRERTKENLKRREANQRKSEIVQVIRNTGKIKKMKRKNLRSIEKRDTTNM